MLGRDYWHNLRERRSRASHKVNKKERKKGGIRNGYVHSGKILGIIGQFCSKTAPFLWLPVMVYYHKWSVSVVEIPQK